jgi:tRNA modification GTPase
LWSVANKADLAGQIKSEPEFNYSISAVTGQGMDALLAALANCARDFFAGAESAVITRARHRHALKETVAALGRALDEAGHKVREELIAEELRAAATALGRLTGRVDVEDILDVIFRDFCIGK